MRYRIALSLLSSIGLLSVTNVLALESVTCEDAVQIAEKFIKQQGYTDEPVSITDDELVFESMEWRDNPKEMFAKRKGTLKPKAIGAFENDPRQWEVAFSYTNPSAESWRGRAVRVEKKTKYALVEHQDVDLSSLNLSCGENPFIKEALIPRDKAIETARKYLGTKKYVYKIDWEYPEARLNQNKSSWVISFMPAKGLGLLGVWRAPAKVEIDAKTGEVIE